MSEREEMADLMLALAEQAMRACIEADLGAALRARAERLLDVAPARISPPAAVETDLPVGRLSYLDLSQIMAGLKAGRRGRLSPTDLAINMLARQKVLAAMRQELDSEAREVAA